MEAYYWLIAMVVLLFIEIITVSLTTIWFAGGALAAFIAALLGVYDWMQITLFFLVSILALIFTRPLAKKFFNSSRETTNYQSVIGMEGKVVEGIDNFEGKGRIVVNGQEWTARSSEGDSIPIDAKVTIVNIEGVKAIVKII